MLGKPPMRLGNSTKRQWLTQINVLIYGPMPSYTLEPKAWERRMKARLYSFAKSKGFVNRGDQDIMIDFVLNQQQFLDEPDQERRERQSIIMAWQHIRGVRDRNRRIYANSQERQDMIANLKELAGDLDEVTRNEIIREYITRPNIPDEAGAARAIQQKKEALMANNAKHTMAEAEEQEIFNTVVGNWLVTLDFHPEVKVLNKLILEALGCEPEKFAGSSGEALGRAQNIIEREAGKKLADVGKPKEGAEDAPADKPEPERAKVPQAEFSHYFGWLANTLTENKVDAEKWEESLRRLVALKMTGGKSNSFKQLSETTKASDLEKVTLDFLHLFTPPTQDGWKLFLEAHNDRTKPKAGARTLAALAWKYQKEFTGLKQFDGVLYEAGQILDEYDHMKAQEAAAEKNKPAEPEHAEAEDATSTPPIVENKPAEPKAPPAPAGNGAKPAEKPANKPPQQNASKPAPRQETALTTTTTINPAVASSPDMVELEVQRQKATILLKSGLLPKQVDTVEKVLVITWMGQALEINQLVALNNINVIAGKPAVSPQLMLGLVRRSKQMETFSCTDDGTTCTVKMKRVGQPEFVATFSADDAQRMTTKEWSNGNSRTITLAEKQNWKEQPKTMRQWRAIAAACRVVFPDITWGLASYTVEELNPDARISEDGEIIEAEMVA